MRVPEEVAVKVLVDGTEEAEFGQVGQVGVAGGDALGRRTGRRVAAVGALAVPNAGNRQRIAVGTVADRVRRPAVRHKKKNHGNPLSSCGCRVRNADVPGGDRSVEDDGQVDQRLAAVAVVRLQGLLGRVELELEIGDGHRRRQREHVAPVFVHLGGELARLVRVRNDEQRVPAAVWNTPPIRVMEHANSIRWLGIRLWTRLKVTGP